MGSSKTTNTYNRQNWEDADFPILCETCLGENPYLRMMKEKYGKECKICARPFTVFRWCPGPKSRFKKTEVCQTCAKVKNICQTCILDLEYGLPVQVRDRALKMAQNMPKSDVNREYFQQQAEQSLDTGGDATVPYGQLGKAQAPSDMLMKLARTTPYYRRNRPHICSFWVKGECRRGEECAYRHEKPTDPDDPLSNQNIKDRFYGVSDPVAEKLMGKYDQMPKLAPPEDRTISTLYVGGLSEEMSEEDMRNYFYQYGEIRSISVHIKQHCAFVQFTTREAAEKAADRSFDKLIIRGRRLNIKWGRSQANQPAIEGGASASSSLAPVPGLPAALPLPPQELFHQQDAGDDNIPSTSGGPSMMFRGPPPPPLPSAPSGSGVIPPPPPPGFLVSAAPPMLSEPPPPGTVPEFIPLPPHRMPVRPPGLPPRFPPPMMAPPGMPPPHLPPPGTAIHYPSQDPSRLGSFAAPHLTKPQDQ